MCTKSRRPRGSTGRVAAMLLVTLVASGCRRSASPKDDAVPAEAEVDAEVEAPSYTYTVAPFRGFRFDQGDWTAYLFLESEELRVLGDTSPRRCLILKDRAVLQELEELEFKPPSGADMATVESALVLVRDGQPVYETNIALFPHRGGLQSLGFGWMEAAPPGALLALVRKFEPLPESARVPPGVPPRIASWCAGLP